MDQKTYTHHDKIKIRMNEGDSLLWTFNCVFRKGKFIIYANGVKSYTSHEADAPSAMLDYFQNWDSEKVKI